MVAAAMIVPSSSVLMFAPRLLTELLILMSLFCHSQSTSQTRFLGFHSSFSCPLGSGFTFRLQTGNVLTHLTDRLSAAIW